MVVEPDFYFDPDLLYSPPALDSFLNIPATADEEWLTVMLDCNTLRVPQYSEPQPFQEPDDTGLDEFNFFFGDDITGPLSNDSENFILDEPMDVTAAILENSASTRSGSISEA